MNTATTAATQLPPGTVIDRSYTTGAVVRSRLGAVTYAATDMSGSRVDVTVYAPECFVSPVALERSLRELRQLEKVHAPQVLRILDAGKLPQGGIYEVHEHVDGESMAELGAISPAEVGPLIHEIVAGLQAAQKVGVLHRNLGAEAVLRNDRGIKLTGFAVGDPQGGVSFGSLDCIAPEQVEGKNIDERTLVYNLAALTYRFLEGASLFTGGDSGTQLLQAAASLPEAESMPAPLFAALAKDPKARPNLLSRFLADLDVIVREFPVRPGAATGASDTHPRHSSHPMRDPDHSTDSARGGEEREVSDTLGPLMTDPDAPKLPSSGNPPAASPTSGTPAPGSRPGTIPPRPAIITGPGMLGTPPPGAPKPAAPPLGAPPSLGGLPNAPSLGSLPKPALPTIGAPPSLGKVPTIGAPPNLGAPAVPTFGAPTVGAPSVAPPTFGAPSVTPPSAAPATASASANAAAKPRTRGWTMFMEVTEDEAGAPTTGGVPLPGAPVTAAPVAAPIAAPIAPLAPLAPIGAPVGAPVTGPAPTPVAPVPTGEVKPSTRGWTMIMDEPTDGEAAGIALSTPAVAASPAPPSPTTRGWTMLEELNDSVPAVVPSATPGVPPVAAAAAAPPEPAPASGAPSSRGWTMFMEAELQGGGTKPEEPEAEPEFYDGPVQTDSGTVVAFAPTAADPNAGARAARVEATADLGSQEPMTSFGARLRGAEEAAPSVASLSPASAPSPSAEIPSFAGNNLGFAVTPVTPATPAAAQNVGRVEPQPDALDQNDDLDAGAGGSSKMIVIGVVVFVIVVVAVILATR